jgi:hypothetical protein
MDVSAIGGGLIGGGPISAASLGATAPLGAACVGCGPPVDAAASAAFAGLPANLNALVSALQGFSSAEILMALMLMNASRGHRTHGSDGAAAMAFLAGWAFGGHGLGSGLSGALSSPMGGVTALTPGLGLQIDLQA